MGRQNRSLKLAQQIQRINEAIVGLEILAVRVQADCAHPQVGEIAWDANTERRRICFICGVEESGHLTAGKWVRSDAKAARLGRSAVIELTWREFFNYRIPHIVVGKT